MRTRRPPIAAGRRSTWACWAAAIAVGPAACARSRPPDPAAAFAAALGCYDVALGPWTEMMQDPPPQSAPPIQASDPPPADDSLLHAIPPRIQLSDHPVEHWTRRPAWSAAAPAGALPVGKPNQTWSLDDAGRLVLDYGNGLYGSGGTLDADGDGWAGTMEGYTDVMGITRWERSVTLLRVDCASPSPVTDESVWLLPRTVELEGGMSLTLGEPPPEGLPTYERSRREPGVTAGTVGLFAGADTLVLVSRSGLVGMVQMEFLPPATPDRLLARLSADYGEPRIWRWPPRPNEPDTVPEARRPIAGYIWEGHVTRIHLSPSERGGFRVHLSDPRLY